MVADLVLAAPQPKEGAGAGPVFLAAESESGCETEPAESGKCRGTRVVTTVSGESDEVPAAARVRGKEGAEFAWASVGETSQQASPPIK